MAIDNVSDRILAAKSEIEKMHIALTCIGEYLKLSMNATKPEEMLLVLHPYGEACFSLGYLKQLILKDNSY